MENTEKAISVSDIGRELVHHSKNLELDGKRGLVIELFPFIFGAHERMSARAVSRFLTEKHGVRLSAVTVTKALNDPKKYWNQFFDTVEPHVEVYEKWEKSAKREEFLFDDEGFKAFHFAGRDFARKRFLKFEFAQAIDALREKWFSIDYATRVKARPYLAERLLGKVK